MLKDNRGITLSALVITIIVLIIIASIATVSGISAVHYVKFQNAKSQFGVVQAKIDNLYSEYNNLNDVTEKENWKNDNFYNKGAMKYSEFDTKLDNSKVTNTLNGLTIDSSTQDNYMYISADFIKNKLQVDGISYDFIINLDERIVRLYGGVEYQNKIYYSAEDFGINIVGFEHQTDFKTAKLQIEEVRNAIQPLYKEYKKMHTQEEIEEWVNTNFEGSIWYTNFDTSLDADKLSNTLKSVSEMETSNGYFYLTSDCIKQSLNLENITCDFLINLSKSNILIYDGIQYRRKKILYSKRFWS